MMPHEPPRHELDAQLDEWRRKLEAYETTIADWRAKAEGLEAEARIDVLERIDRLESRIESVRRHLEESKPQLERLKAGRDEAWNDIKSGAGAAWDSLLAGVQDAWTELKQAYESASSRLK